MGPATVPAVDDPSPFCPGCGDPVGRCEGRCGRAGGIPRFCRACGRRLREIVVVPAWTALACPHHGRVDDVGVE